MAKPAKFAHIVYRTRRFEEMIGWYEQVFEARVQYKNPALAFLTYDDEHHRFAFANLSVLDPTGKSSGGKQQGIAPYWPIRHGPTLSFYYRDPDGNRIEFQVDCFPTADEANAYMQGDAFSSNPIGVNFDPDELVEQFRKGVPERQLLVRPEGPPAPIPREHGIGA